MRRVKLFVLCAVLGTVFAAAGAFWSPGGLAATNTTINDVCNGISFTGSAGCGDQGKGVNNAVSVIINILSAVVGLVAVIMIIIAGVRFVTSGGDPAQVKGAKSALIYAIVGIVIVALAQLIVHTVISDVIK